MGVGVGAGLLAAADSENSSALAANRDSKVLLLICFMGNSVNREIYFF